ncbi:hypothetical protein FOL47_011028, partial [Perkinsus chesapeaki]
MRSFIFAILASVAVATEDPCTEMCSYINGCADSKYGSYCKSWLTNPICFGLAKMSDGSICFQPTDPQCNGEPIACDTTSTPEATTSEGPVSTSWTTTEAAETSTTGA